MADCKNYWYLNYISHYLNLYFDGCPVMYALLINTYNYFNICIMYVLNLQRYKIF